MYDLTIKYLVESRPGEEMLTTMIWAVTGLLVVLAIGLVIWTIIAFLKMTVELDMNQKKAIKKDAIHLSIASFVTVIIASSVAPIFFAIPVELFLSDEATSTVLLVILWLLPISLSYIILISSDYKNI